MSISQQAVASRTQAGTMDFDAFYAAHFRRLHGAMTLYTGDAELAADLAQETMARAFRDWDRVSRHANPVAWIHRVAINHATSTFRRSLAERRTFSRLQMSARLAPAAADTGDAVAVRKAVGSLPARQRTALVLRYYVGMSVTEVAAVMKCAEGTVRALTSQALGSMRRNGLLDDPEVDDD